MQRCLELASKGAGHVAPNPMVGCVIVHNGHIIGEGYHQNFGGPHAEVNAIRAVADEELLKEATLYVNLEPCSHHGKTPPCADLIAEKKIPYVVIGCLDENPVVRGHGIAKLVAQGVDVKTGVLEETCRHLNRRFFTYVTQKRPYVILKWAQSADGFIDHDRDENNGERAIVSSADSHLVSHRWRSEEAAILVGTNTVLTDNPQLTVRLIDGPNPVRVTFDRSERIPSDAKILDGTAPTLIFNAKAHYYTSRAEYFPLDFSIDPLPQALRVLYEKNLMSVLVEGGAAILSKFLADELWDEARVFISPDSFSNGVKAPVLVIEPDEEITIGTDRLLTYYKK
jgi:diaminohydroxyphosphoribosylaminopyrimidine deaminase / 5-amino-6-(5-phosphoribosylamino)uracil reductase